MNKEQFLKALRESKLSRHYFFVCVGETQDGDTEDYSIVVVSVHSQRVMCSFCYDTSGLIYRLSVNDISFYSLKELLDTINNILEQK